MDIQIRSKPIAAMLIAMSMMVPQAFGAFSTCRDQGTTTVPVTACVGANPEGDPEPCIAGTCTGGVFYSGSSCGFSLNPCAGCNDGSTSYAIAYDYEGSCVFEGDSTENVCLCYEPQAFPSNYSIVVPECTNYNSCLGG